MAQESRDQIKTYFETGDTPTQEQFGKFIDSTTWYDERATIEELLAASTTEDGYQLVDNIYFLAGDATYEGPEAELYLSINEWGYYLQSDENNYCSMFATPEDLRTYIGKPGVAFQQEANTSHFETKFVFYPESDPTYQIIYDLDPSGFNVYDTRQGYSRQFAATAPEQNYPDDAAAAAAGIGIGQYYHTDGVVKIRLS